MHGLNTIAIAPACAFYVPLLADCLDALFSDPSARMKTVQKSVLIWYSAAEMFSLVADVAKYPEFLPWCDQARVLATHADGVTAEIGLALAGLHQRFTTRNTYDPDRSVVLHLVQGPFSELEGQWTFAPVGEPGQRGCKVQLQLQYGFSNAPLAALIGPLFDRIAASLVDAFVKRAGQVYG